MKLLQSMAKSAKGFALMSPMLLGVIFAIALFDTLISDAMLRALFTGEVLRDMGLAIVAGSVSIGQPVASYIIGGELLHSGVSLYAVAAFIVAWVTVGLVQLPLELSLFGSRFTWRRNLLSLLFACAVAAATAASTELFL